MTPSRDLVVTILLENVPLEHGRKPMIPRLVVSSNGLNIYIGPASEQGQQVAAESISELVQAVVADLLAHLEKTTL